MTKQIAKQEDRSTQKAAKQEDRPTRLSRTLKNYLMAGGPQKALAMANEHVKPERFTRILLQAAQRNPKLLEVAPEALLKALLDCASWGLEPKGRGGAWLVPFKNNKRGCWEVQVITDYRGELAMARRSGEIKSISTHVVYENDVFELEYGDEERLIHTPCLEGARGKPKFWYAIAKLKDGGIQRAVLTREEVDKTRSRSRAKTGPWETDYDAMALKTAVRRLCNLLPMPDFYNEQVERERERERLADEQDSTAPAETFAAEAFDVIETEATEAQPTEEPTSRADALKAQLEASVAQEEQRAETPPAAAEQSSATQMQRQELGGLYERLGGLFGDGRQAEKLWTEHVSTGADPRTINAVDAETELERARALVAKKTQAVECGELLVQLREMGGEHDDIPEDAHTWTKAKLGDTRRELVQRIQAIRGEGDR